VEGSERVLRLAVARTSIDALYEAFRERLPEPLGEPARGLAFRLRLAPSLSVPWSDVFGHAVTLEAPVLVAEGWPSVTQGALDEARRAHLFAVIGAFGEDRVEDGQTVADGVLIALLSAIRHERDAALVALCGPDGRALALAADETTTSAIRAERALLGMGRAVEVETYERIAAGKQAVGMLAAVALARCSGASEEEERRVHGCLLDVAVGLQLVDDVRDWEDDAASGGAWAVLLAGGTRGAVDASALRARVHASGVLADLLARAKERYARAADAARAIGALRLASWAGGRASECAEGRERETTSPGYLVRKRRLAALAEEIFR
jgi:hypothetical protein